MEEWTNHYLDSNGDPLQVEAFLDLDVAIECATEGADYSYTVHTRDGESACINLDSLIQEYRADVEHERRWELRESQRQYG